MDKGKDKNNKSGFFAFISYSSIDIEWGKKVHDRLEYYRMPTTLCSEHNLSEKPMNPIFFAPYDIQPGPLSKELKQRLNDSQNLIVIGSPNSAQSEWVGKEIEYYHKELKRTNKIHYFIVSGIPNSGDKATECYHPILKELGIPEILGANINEKIYRFSWLNKERAYIQLISKLLGVEFDSIWQRHKRILVQKAIAWGIGVIIILSTIIGVWLYNQPFSMTVSLNEASIPNKELPNLQNATVALELDNEIKTGTIKSLNDSVFFHNLPHRYCGKQAHITVSCQDFINIDTIVVLSDKISLGIFRNPAVYGNVSFRIWNPFKEKAISNAKVKINDFEVFTDNSGYVSTFIPLDLQRQAYKISTIVPLAKDTIHMPFAEKVVLLTTQ